MYCTANGSFYRNRNLQCKSKQLNKFTHITWQPETWARQPSLTSTKKQTYTQYRNLQCKSKQLNIFTHTTWQPQTRARPPSLTSTKHCTAYLLVDTVQCNIYMVQHLQVVTSEAHNSCNRQLNMHSCRDSVLSDY